MTTLARIESNTAELVKAKNDHETRIRKLEAFRLLLMGMWIILSIAIGYTLRK